MKIEMGESLFYSWLRHVKHCQVVQTNWKPSGSWTGMNNEKLSRMKERLEDFIQQSGQELKVFGKQRLSQFIQQAEIDVLGINIGDQGKVNVHCVDVAFHEGSLNYGDTQETISRIIKKIIRAFMTINCYFDTDAIGSLSIYFASPKINPVVMGRLMGVFEQTVSFLLQSAKNMGMNYACNIELIANADFKVVLNDLMAEMERTSDTSELFMRAVKLFEMASEETRGTRNILNTNDNDENDGQTDNQNNIGENNMKVNTPEEVIRILRDKFNLPMFAQIQRRRIMFEGYCQENPGRKIILCTPYSRLHRDGKGWIDVNASQVELMRDHYGLFVFRIDVLGNFFVSYKKLSEYLTAEALTNNEAEGDHWKLYFWPHCIEVLGNNRTMNIEPNDINNIDLCE